MEAKIIPLDSKQPSLEATLIIGPWSYHSIFGTGSDFGYNFCMYMPKEGLAVYIHSRYQMNAEVKKDIFERSTLLVHKTLDEQLRYLKSLDDPTYLEPAIAIPKVGMPVSTPPKRKLFVNPTIKPVSLSRADLGLFFKPLRGKEDTAPLFDLLYSYVDGK